MTASAHAVASPAPVLNVEDSDEYGTPAYILDAARRVGPIGLDPSDRAGSLTAARVSIRRERGENGLSVNWREMIGKGEVIWLQPPYSAGNLPVWVTRAGLVAPTLHVSCAIVSLLPVNTAPRWFQGDELSICSTAAAICFLSKRVAHHRPDGTLAKGTRHDSMAIYWGRNPLKFELAFEGLGRVVYLGAGR